MLSPNGELTPGAIAHVIADRLAKVFGAELIGEQARGYSINCKAAEGFTRAVPDADQRVPYFCSGCPHNTSTKVPEGSRRSRPWLPLHGDVNGPQHRDLHADGRGVCVVDGSGSNTVRFEHQVHDFVAFCPLIQM